MTSIDKPKAVRVGEELDLQKLSHFFADQLGVSDPLSLFQFPGGSSNLTYLVSGGGKEWVLRKPPPGVKAKSAHDMVREAKILRDIKARFDLVPQVIAICEDETVLGAPFFLMERVQGTILRAKGSDAEHLSEVQRHQICHQAVQALVQIHQIPWETSDLASLSKGPGYVQRQISGWSKRFEKAWTQDVPKFKKIMQWLHDHMPQTETLSLIHNDYRLDNLVLSPVEPTQILAVLDWEMATIGDPLMDLGNSLAYWVEAGDPEPLLRMRQQPTHLSGMMNRQEFLDFYLESRGLDVADFSYYRVYGLFRLAVIIQQIYLRFCLGQTQDQRFKHFGALVGVFETYITQILECNAS